MLIWYMELSAPIHEYLSVYTCAYTCTQAYFHKILLFNQFTPGKPVFWEAEFATFFFARILSNFPAGLSRPPETAALFKTARPDLKQDFVFFVGRERFRGCLSSVVRQQELLGSKIHYEQNREVPVNGICLRWTTEDHRSSFCGTTVWKMWRS